MRRFTYMHSVKNGHMKNGKWRLVNIPSPMGPMVVIALAKNQAERPDMASPRAGVNPGLLGHTWIIWEYTYRTWMRHGICM